MFIVTAASQEMAELLAHVLVLDGGIGMRSEVRDGVYTGRPPGPFTYREGKAEAIRELAAERGIDLAESYAYSDSESDLPMLRAVGHPVAVNPDAELERIARAEGWRIMRFDKLGRQAEARRGSWARSRSWAAAGATWRRGLRPRPQQAPSRPSLARRASRASLLGAEPSATRSPCRPARAPPATPPARRTCRCPLPVPLEAHLHEDAVVAERSRRSPPPACQSGNTPSISSRNRRTPACPQ